MPGGVSFSDGVLGLLLNGENLSGFADNATGEGAHDNLFLALYTGAPNDLDITDNEADYDDYARVAVARDSETPAWDVYGATATNSSPVAFPASGGESDPVTVSHVGLVTTSSGVGEMIRWAALSEPIEITAGDTPTIPAEAIVISMAAEEE